MCIFGLIAYGYSLQYYRIAPGYLHLLDFQSVDLIRFKVWSHIDSYFLGIMIGFSYETIKYIRFEASEDEKKRWIIRLIKYFVDGPTSTFLFINLSAFSFLISAYLHMLIDQYSDPKNQGMFIEIDDNLIFWNSIIMVVAKILANISMVQWVLAVICGRFQLLNHFLQSYTFQFINRSMPLSYLLVPIISKSYQASLTSSFTQNVNFVFYLTFFSLIVSLFGAALLYAFIQCPIYDFFRYCWNKIEIRSRCRPDAG